MKTDKDKPGKNVKRINKVIGKIFGKYPPWLQSMPGRFGLRRGAPGLLAACLAFANTASLQALAQESEGSGQTGSVDRDTVYIPEPMVFDLVRGLGAKRGELEVNVLAEIPVDDRSSRNLQWAPEVEYAILDGLALEFELPFQDDELESFKLAAQLTFGTALDGHFIHGTQFIAERDAEFDLWELTFLYIPGIRLGETWSALAMIGLRSEVGSDTTTHNEALVNFSLFADIHDELTVGVESDLAVALDGDAEWLLMPQVHYEITDRFMVQAGVGVELEVDKADTTAAFRVIYSFCTPCGRNLPASVGGL